jgi:hypothetical protein
MVEGEGVEPSTQRSARLSRPVAHHCAPPSVSMSWLSRRDLNARPPLSKSGALPLSYGTVRPGGLEPPTAPQSGAHDGYKPSALPVELWAQALIHKYNTREMVRAVGFEPTASCFQGRSSGLAELHPVIFWTIIFWTLALRREIESLSPDRQSGRLTRCVTELQKKIGASPRSGTDAAIASALLEGKYGIHRIATRHSVAVGIVRRSWRCAEIKAAL